MFEVIVKINVKNHCELQDKYSQELKNDKFQVGSINEKIEGEIKKQVKDALDNSIRREFLKNKIKAKISMR